MTLDFCAKVLCDSQSRGSRLTTMELTYPRLIHSEFMTHRMFSRNSASSRAIPVAKMLQNVQEHPFVPVDWGKNQKGMQAGEQLNADVVLVAKATWLGARDDAVSSAEILNEYGLHKQIINRLVEPWMWITVIATAVDHGWENFFNLRCHPDAEPHMQKVAYLARDAYDGYCPTQLEVGQDHLPLSWSGEDDENGGDMSRDDLRKVSVGRCARVSYLTHDGKRDPQADIDLHDRLASSGHWSPFEHVATVAKPTDEINRGGNFGPNWVQYRKTFEGECCRKAKR